MPKLITIHGTNAGDASDNGSLWWQKGSGFQAHLNELLDLQNSAVEVVPFHWDKGPNSEAERRKAGFRLFQLLSGYEKECIDYCVIGHSHGGSVFHHALLASVRAGKRLERLRLWITVGTPFISFQRKRFLFQRSSPVGQAAYLLAAFAVLYGLSQVFIASDLAKEASSASSNILLEASVVIVLGLLMYSALVAYDAIYKSHYGQMQKLQCAKWYAPRWRGFYHPEDEALGSLRSVSRLGGPIFSRSFLVPSFSLIPVILAVGLLVAMMRAAEIIYSHHTEFPLQPLVDYGKFLSQPAQFLIADLGSLVVLLPGTFISLYLLVLICRAIGYLVGVPLSSIINSSVWSRFRSVAWGEDMLGEYVKFVDASPEAFPRECVKLSRFAVETMDDFVREHSVVTLEKARSILALRHETGLAPDAISQIGAALSWNELLHTTYFEVPEVVRLFAVILDDAGFGRFRDDSCSDADKARAKLWLDEFKRTGS